MPNLWIDYSFTHPNPATIKRAGYRGVLRYVTGKGKAITASEVAALHKAGLSILLVFESTAGRATQGFKAGVTDRKAAEKAAKALGYPKACPIFYAVDSDVRPAQVAEYFRGILSLNKVGLNHVGVYGSAHIVEAYPSLYTWQTSAWSNGVVSNHAAVYQRQHSTVDHPIAGTDENVILRSLPTWAPKAATPPAPVQPTPHPANPDHDLVVAQDRWRTAKGF